MIARLSDLSASASPTAFHKLLRTLDDRGKLLRVYTQNIDALELKAGLTFGVPSFDERRYRTRPNRSKTASLAQHKPTSTLPTPPPGSQSGSSSSHSDSHSSSSSPSSPHLNEHESSASSSNTTPIAGPSRLPSPLAEIPRCIPLHGTLQSMYCQICRYTFPLTPHLPSLSLGIPPDCPECTSLEATRALVGKRPRGVGKLRPGVVLYNEEHRDAEGVGEVARKDLTGVGNGDLLNLNPSGNGSGNGNGNKNGGRENGRSLRKRGAGPDLLLVVGTSLRVPGTKRIVREFSKAVRVGDRGSSVSGQGNASATSATASSFSSPSSSSWATSGNTAGKLPTPSPSPRRTPTFSPSSADEASRHSEDAPIRTIYLNLDFPMPTREWDGVFDVWVQGDAQLFADIVKEEIRKEDREREIAAEKRKRREQDMKIKELEQELEKMIDEAYSTAAVVEAARGNATLEKAAKERAMRARLLGQKTRTMNLTPFPTKHAKGTKRKVEETILITPYVPKKRKVILIVRPPPADVDDHSSVTTSEGEEEEEMTPIPRRLASSPMTPTRASRVTSQLRTPMKPSRTPSQTHVTGIANHTRRSPRRYPEVVITIPPLHGIKRPNAKGDDHDSGHGHGHGYNACINNVTPRSTPMTPPTSVRNQTRSRSRGRSGTQTRHQRPSTPAISPSRHHHIHAGKPSDPEGNPSRNNINTTRKVVKKMDIRHLLSESPASAANCDTNQFEFGGEVDGSLVRTLQYGLRSTRGQRLQYQC